MALKYCKECGWKPISEFSRHKSTYDRLQPICKECDRIRFKKYYQENKKKVIEKNKLWIENNRERHNIIARKCFEKANSRNSAEKID